MKEELVSFETAKLLKEKGFIKAGFIGVPTQSLAQKWLRDKYGIDITVALVTTGYGFYIHKNRNYTNNGEHYNTLVPTYEEALEDGLKESLKLIE